MKKHFFINSIGVFLSLSIAYFVMVSDSNLLESLTLVTYILISILGICLSYLVYYSSIQLDKYYSFHRNIGLRLLLGICIHLIFCFSIIGISIYGYSYYAENVLNFWVVYKSIFIKTGILTLLSLIFYHIIYFAFYSYNSYTTFHISSIRQERKQIELQLKALKSQLSPHFLFNSLNTISSLIYKDLKSTQIFIRQLSKLYEYTIDSYDLKLVNFDEELAFVKSYLFLITTRFPESFECKIDLSKDLNTTKIPPLALQMLIENAIKHNQLLKNDPLHIVIQKEGDFISITNNVTKTPVKVTSFKIGLKNINSRYLLLAGKGIQVSNGQYFKVKIPIIV